MRALTSTVLFERARIKTTAPFVLIACILVTMIGPARIAAAGQDCVIQVSAVLASKDRREFDPRLASLRRELSGLPFKGYTLLGVQACRVEAGDHCAMDIPGGGYLHLIATQRTDKHLKMRVLLNQQNRPILNADIKLDRGAGILLKGVRTEVGVIILSIRPLAADDTAAARVAR